jgi:hypothetical protein
MDAHFRLPLRGGGDEGAPKLKAELGGHPAIGSLDQALEDRSLASRPHRRAILAALGGANLVDER